MPIAGSGIAYCINDSRPYRAMLDLSLRSLKRFHSDLPIEVIKLRSGSDFFDSLRWHMGSTAESLVRRVTVGDEYGKKARHQAMAEKVRLFSDPPFERTLYLDCDTVVLRPLDAVFDRLAAGADVVVQAWAEGAVYGPVPPFATEPFRKYNSGVVGLTPAFARGYAALVAGCTVDIPSLHDQDQYVFSQVLHRFDRHRVAEIPDLQVFNDGRTSDPAGQSRRICGTDRPDAMVYHYIWKKKACFDALRRRI